MAFQVYIILKCDLDQLIQPISLSNFEAAKHKDSVISENSKEIPK